MVLIISNKEIIGIINNAMEFFEIKRKIFEVEEKIGERTYRVVRNGKVFFLKDFENDKKGFEEYVDTEWRLNSTGIPHPKIYAYDKNELVVVSEYIDGPTVLEDLMKQDLSDEYFINVFKANWFSKKGKLPIDFDPELWKMVNGKLYYLGPVSGTMDDKSYFEKAPMRLWYYTKDFAKYLIRKGLSVDKTRVPDNEAAINKQMALTVVKYYI